MPHRIRLLLTTLVLLVVLLPALLSVRAQPLSRHLALGNPSGATTDVNQPANYLISRDQYALAYSRDLGIPIWVSWNTTVADRGSAPRYSGNFITDTSLPAGWPRITHDDYTNSGYDRGHMVPSDDRDSSAAANRETFFMTNIVPQAPALNRGPWLRLEEFARARVAAGDEVFMVAGPLGNRGSLAGGTVRLPEATWKALLSLPDGSDDPARVTTDAHVAAAFMPNDPALVTQSDPWQRYCTTVDELEQASGFDFFASVPDAVEAVLEARVATSDAAHIRATAGISQSVTVGGTFTQALQARVCSDEGLPVSGVQVIFRTPMILSSGAFAGNLNEVVVTTDSRGLATAPALTANGLTGVFSATVILSGTNQTDSYRLTNLSGAALPTRRVFLPIVVRPAEGTAPTATVTTTATSTATTGPSPTPTLPPPSFVNCATPPNAATAPNYPVRIVTVDKSAETVTLRNVTTGDTIDLTGWRMCSLSGGQQHPLSGTLTPGQERIFPNTGGAIWSNSSSDPGALYDPQGRLVSYWAD